LTITRYRSANENGGISHNCIDDSLWTDSLDSIQLLSN
jgi:hypothetical protein